MARDWLENLKSGIRRHCKHLCIALNECCHCIIHHTSTLIYLSAIISLCFRLIVIAFQDQLRDIAKKTSKPAWSKQIPEKKIPWTLFDWQKKKKGKNIEICAGFYGKPANSRLCNAEWQLPLKRTGFLIRINARRHSDLLRGYGINMDRELTETFQPCRGEPYYSTCTQTGGKWLISQR